MNATRTFLLLTMTDNERQIGKHLLASARECGFSISNDILNQSFTGRPVGSIVTRVVICKDSTSFTVLNGILWKYTELDNNNSNYDYSLRVLVYKELTPWVHKDLFIVIYSPRVPDLIVTRNLYMKFLIIGESIIAY